MSSFDGLSRREGSWEGLLRGRVSLSPPLTDSGANREVGTCWGDRHSSHLIRHFEGLPRLPLSTDPPPKDGHEGVQVETWVSGWGTQPPGLFCINTNRSVLIYKSALSTPTTHLCGGKIRFFLGSGGTLTKVA